MKAMILAAGKGTRVQPITHVIPKPMIPILQKPVMEFLLELLKEHGFTEVMVNVSHLAEEIENYFRDGQRFGVEIAYSFEGRIEDYVDLKFNGSSYKEHIQGCKSNQETKTEQVEETDA